MNLMSEQFERRCRYINRLEKLREELALEIVTLQKLNRDMLELIVGGNRKNGLYDYDREEEEWACYEMEKLGMFKKTLTKSVTPIR